MYHYYRNNDGAASDDGTEIDLIGVRNSHPVPHCPTIGGRAKQPSLSNARKYRRQKQGNSGKEAGIMMRRAATISAAIHQDGHGEGGGKTSPPPQWLKQMRSETNASIAFMVQMIQNQSTF